MKLFWKILGFIFLILLCLEIALHFYNPFTSRVKNGRIVLPINVKYELEPNAGGKLDSKIIHSKNSLGFRGPELTDSARIKIICMGGSTTECFYLNDGKDWPNVLGVQIRQKNPRIWLNNAGMDGQSTHGHLKMLKQYILKLKPDYIIFMCGLNEMGLDTGAKFDNPESGWFNKIYHFLELPATLVNISRAGQAKQAGLNHVLIQNMEEVEKLEMSDSVIFHRLEAEKVYVERYKKRLEQLIKICKTNHIKPIFVGQSILYANEKDLFSNVYLGNLKTGDINGKTRSYIMKMYNKATYDVSRKAGLPFINLSARLPKDSRFFYDGYHFTNDGAEMTAEIVFDEITKNQLIPEISHVKH